MTSSVSGSGILSPESFSIIHSREASDSSESYSSLDLSSEASSDDEIVWSLSDNDSGESQSPLFIRSQGALSPATFSDDDVVVLNRPERYQTLVAPGSVEALASTLSNLHVGLSRTVPAPTRSPASSSRSQRKKKRKAIAAGTAGTTAAHAASLSTTSSPTKSARRRAKRAAAEQAKLIPAATPTGTSSDDDFRSVVDDVSEGEESSAYEEAVQYVNEILANPAPTANSNLKLLHALIIELGLAPAAKVSSLGKAVEVLPRSLRATKALLKQHVFLNVCDYLAVRHKGLAALRNVMHPSRKALVTAIRSEKKKMPAKEVKKTGLGVFLVTCYR